MDEPVKRLARMYDVATKDENATQHIRDVTDNGLVTINKNGIIDKFKVCACSYADCQDPVASAHILMSAAHEPWKP